MSQLVDFQHLNESLKQHAEQYWQQLLTRCADVMTNLAQPLSTKRIEQIKYCFAMSDFIAESCIYQPKVFTAVFTNDTLDAAQLAQYRLQIKQLVQLTNEQQFCQQIRMLRKTLMVHIAALDLCQMQSIEQSYLHISQLSDELIMAAYRFAYQQVSTGFGCPKDEQGEPMPLIILGMGKLGGMELNFSSDIDLICCYASGGQTSGGRKVIDNQMFFTKVAQKFIQYLHQNEIESV